MPAPPQNSTTFICWPSLKALFCRILASSSFILLRTTLLCRRGTSRSPCRKDAKGPCRVDNPPSSCPYIRNLRWALRSVQKRRQDVRCESQYYNAPPPRYSAQLSASLQPRTGTRRRFCRSIGLAGQVQSALPDGVVLACRP